MGDRIIVRKDGVPVAFNGSIIEYVRCGKKSNPQEYTPDHKPHGLGCKKSHHKMSKKRHHRHSHRHHGHRHHHRHDSNNHEGANPAWIHATEVTAPLAGTVLVNRTVGTGKKGYIYGFFISAQEANNFLVNWTSGGVARNIRIIFSAAGTTQDTEDTVPLNRGLSADAGTHITITNVNATAAGQIYQARLFYAEV